MLHFAVPWWFQSLLLLLYCLLPLLLELHRQVGLPLPGRLLRRWRRESFPRQREVRCLVDQGWLSFGLSACSLKIKLQNYQSQIELMISDILEPLYFGVRRKKYSSRNFGIEERGLLRDGTINFHFLFTLSISTLEIKWQHLTSVNWVKIVVSSKN